MSENKMSKLISIILKFLFSITTAIAADFLSNHFSNFLNLSTSKICAMMLILTSLYVTVDWVKSEGLDTIAYVLAFCSILITGSSIAWILSPFILQKNTSNTNGSLSVEIPSSLFVMGSDSDNGRHNELSSRQIRLSTFWINQTEVTNSQYRLCVNEGHCDRPLDERFDFYENYYEASQFDDYPVVNITWYDAEDYCEWAGMRLPTEEEWEKAARGTEGALYPWGNTQINGNRLNFCDKACDASESQHDDGFVYTSSVKSYPQGASPYGVLGMLGNVWEWTESKYEEDPSERIIKGGSYADHEKLLHASLRSSYEPSTRRPNLGFRCVGDRQP